MLALGAERIAQGAALRPHFFLILIPAAFHGAFQCSKRSGVSPHLLSEWVRSSKSPVPSMESLAKSLKAGENK